MMGRERFLLLVAGVFVALNAVALSLAEQGGLAVRHFWAPAIWLGLMAGAHVLLERLKPEHDPLILPLVGLLMGWGIVLLDRLAPNFLGRQVVWMVLGVGLMVGVAVVPAFLRILRRYRYTWLLFGLLLLAATLLFGVNPSGYGAALWLQLPFLGRVFFQPSELLKLLLIVFLASYFEERAPLLQTDRGVSGTVPYLLPLLLMWGFCLIFLVWQRDLGAATLFFLLFLALLYLATGEWRYVWAGLALLAIAGILGYFAFDVVALRVDAWWNPWPEFDGRAFQIVQSLYALGSGGLLGQGIGQGFPTYIPVVHSDFVFAAIVEEWGLVGGLAVVVCFAVLAYRGLQIALRTRQGFYIYLSAGIAILFTAQSFLIMAGVTKLLPLTGVTLPFLSYGGSSFLISSLMAGLLLFLSAEESFTISE